MRKILSNKELDLISQATLDRCSRLGLKHAQKNQPFIENTILDLKKEKRDVSHAIVISAGPSLHIQNPAKDILKSKYNGLIISADGALYYCLRNRIVPDYVVSVDPHPERIIRLFGDPELKSTANDDYFRRQDLDPALNKDELSRNKEIIKLVNKHGRKIRMAISTSVTPRITKRCLQAKMKLYWWNPIYDDYDKKDSLTRKIFNITKTPCMATGGNVGTSAWVFAVSVLGVKDVALVGMDFSYHRNTPLDKTQYYHELKDIFTDNLENGFIKIRNPHLKENWYTDPAYFWYRTNFLKLAGEIKSVTYNCTEGGILFGKNVKFIKLKDFLKKIKTG